MFSRNIWLGVCATLRFCNARPQGYRKSARKTHFYEALESGISEENWNRFRNSYIVYAWHCGKATFLYCIYSGWSEWYSNNANSFFVFVFVFSVKPKWKHARIGTFVHFKNLRFCFDESVSPGDATKSPNRLMRYPAFLSRSTPRKEKLPKSETDWRWWHGDNVQFPPVHDAIPLKWFQSALAIWCPFRNIDTVFDHIPFRNRN